MGITASVRRSTRHHQVRDQLSRLVVERRRDVAVDAQRDGDRRVPEALLDDTGVDAPLKREGRPGVSQALQGQPGHVVPAAAPEEHLTHRVGPEPAASRAVKHQVEIVEVGADEQPFLQHPVTVFPEDGNRGRIQ